MVEVVEAGGAMQLVQVPLQAADISGLLETEPHRVTMYIADPQLQPLVGDLRAQFRDLKVCHLLNLALYQHHYFPLSHSQRWTAQQ